ncbi:MAG: hypothetical protein PHT40_00655 [Patescibacteria group bacterium]|nr:hypothetical protein [Patescibacteria group bacterium]
MIAFGIIVMLIGILFALLHFFAGGNKKCLSVTGLCCAIFSLTPSLKTWLHNDPNALVFQVISFLIGVILFFIGLTGKKN